MLTYADLLRGLPGSDNAAVVDVSSTDVTLSPPCRRLYVGGTGDVKVDTVGGQTVTFQSVPVGYLDVRATKVYHSGSSATKLVALW